MNVRKLVALDMVFHGQRLILLELGAGVGIPLLIGILMLTRGRFRWETVLGWYMLALSLNYVPLLVHAINLGTREKAAAEVQNELGAERDGAIRSYGVGALVLLLPLVVPVMAVVQALWRPKLRSGGTKVC